MFDVFFLFENTFFESGPHQSGSKWLPSQCTAMAYGFLNVMMAQDLLMHLCFRLTSNGMAGRR
jgi:hypothetical protein